jgi:hypothetical protein
MQDKILILYHCDAGTGYAIEKLELVFWEMAMNLTGGESANIFLSYRDYPHGFPTYVPEGFKNFYTFFSREQNRQKLKAIAEYVRSNEITVVFGFDQPVHLPYYRFVRKAGVRRIISYWGAPMSSINKGLKLWFKKLEVAMISKFSWNDKYQ